MFADLILSPPVCLQGLRRMLYAHAEFVKGKKWQRASIFCSCFTLVFVISLLKRRFWQVVFIGTCWKTPRHTSLKGALWLTCVDADCLVALFWKLLRWFLTLWLQFVPAAMTVSGLLNLEVFPASQVWMCIPPVLQIHTPTQTYLWNCMLTCVLLNLFNF